MNGKLLVKTQVSTRKCVHVRQKITKEELKRRLAEHAAYLDNDKDTVQTQLCLHGVDLSGMDLEGEDLTDAELVDCDFTGANLKGVTFTRANLDKSVFTRADLRNGVVAHASLYGTVFDEADLTDADLEYALMREDTRFAGATLVRACLVNLDAREVNFEGANLTKADMRGSDLYGACLRNANLNKADLAACELGAAELTGATFGDLHIPHIEDIDLNILEAATRKGQSIDMRHWHRCKTTHCRAGWAIELAGVEGANLEHLFAPSVAGALIYAASGSHPVPSWSVSDEEALEDLKKRAGLY